MKRLAFIGVLLGLLPLKQRAATKISPSQIDFASGDKLASFSTDIFDLRAVGAANAINVFRLTAPGSAVAPTLATVWVYADGRLLAESYDYSVSSGTVTMFQAYFGVIVQIRYLSA